nr:Zn-dependent hydrolase [Evansella caseinilytica]
MKDYDHRNDHSGVSGERLAKRLSQLSEIGLTTGGGSCRIGFSNEELQAKEMVKEWMEGAGLEVRMDGAGNLFGRIHGKYPDKAAVLSGSHLDSVPNGGHFDGPLGVLAALEVAEAWKATDYIPERPYEVVVFTDEEGSRFNNGLLGSSAVVGGNDKEILLQTVDMHGKAFQDVIEENGLTLEQFFQSEQKREDIAAFIEVHIEQGKRLEKENLPVGFVTGIAGPCWLELTFTGKAGHAGNTPMDDRYDALVAAGDFVRQVEALPSNISPSAVATVGQLNVFPNGVNVIPGKVTLTVDIRDIFLETRDRLVAEVLALAKAVTEPRNIQLQVEEKVRIEPVPIKADMQRKARAAIEKQGITPYALPSGAGHDAMILGRHLPVAMLFVRSKDGVSHHPAEWTDLNDCVIAVHTLKQLLEDL